MMTLLNYNVIFKRSKDDLKKKNTLTFKNILLEKPFNVPTQFIIELKKLSNISQNIVAFQNIEEVIKIGSDPSHRSYNYYFILLYTIKSNNKKEGFLIGNVKNLGDIIIGVWPFNKQINSDLSPENISQIMNDLIKKPHEYSNICLIN